MNTHAVFAAAMLLCVMGAALAQTNTATQTFSFAPGSDTRTFSTPLPEGNYLVAVTFGSNLAPSATTVRAETRRLVLEQVQTAPGKSETRTFAVNVRRPEISTGGNVHLKPREVGSLSWDDKLTLAFDGARPAVRRVQITPAPTLPTLFLMGDSTVTDQAGEPYCAWGQMLPRFFGPQIAVANYAESGESLRSTLAARRLDKVLSVLKAGDFVFIQFGHNDQKERGEGVGAFTTYKADLLHYVDEIRKKGGVPILVTPVNRRRFDAAGHLVPTLGDYPDAVRQAAAEQKVALIDLNAISKTLFEAMGPDGTLGAFVHYPANTFVGQTAALKDDTHFNNYGAYELAKCIVQGIRDNKLPLVKFFTPDAPLAFDPAHPDPASAWHLPASDALPAAAKPDGS